MRISNKQRFINNYKIINSYENHDQLYFNLIDNPRVKDEVTTNKTCNNISIEYGSCFYQYFTFINTTCYIEIQRKFNQVSCTFESTKQMIPVSVVLEYDIEYLYIDSKGNVTINFISDDNNMFRIIERR